MSRKILNFHILTIFRYCWWPISWYFWSLKHRWWHSWNNLRWSCKISWSFRYTWILFAWFLFCDLRAVWMWNTFIFPNNGSGFDVLLWFFFFFDRVKKASIWSSLTGFRRGHSKLTHSCYLIASDLRHVALKVLLHFLLFLCVFPSHFCGNHPFYLIWVL